MMIKITTPDGNTILWEDVFSDQNVVLAYQMLSHFEAMQVEAKLHLPTIHETLQHALGGDSTQYNLDLEREIKNH